MKQGFCKHQMKRLTLTLSSPFERERRIGCRLAARFLFNLLQRLNNFRQRTRAIKDWRAGERAIFFLLT